MLTWMCPSPTLFTVAGQFLGIGPVSGVFYFLYITFGPTSSDLARSAQGRTIWHKGTTIHLLLTILLLHTSEVFAMFLAPDFDTRHYWTWAWQLSPLWIGIVNSVLDQALSLLRLKRTLSTSSPATLLIALGLVSSGVWLYALVFSHYTLAETFIPDVEQFEYVAHSRRALQADELGVVSTSLLWQAYSFFDLYNAGLLGNEWLFYAASLPIIAVGLGPGTAISIGWYLRERALASSPKR